MTHVVQPRAFQQQPLVELLLRLKRLSAYLKARVGILCGRFQLRKTAQNDILHAGFPRGIIQLVVSRIPKLLATIQLFDTLQTKLKLPNRSRRLLHIRIGGRLANQRALAPKGG